MLLGPTLTRNAFFAFGVTFTEYGTSGLETMASSLLINLGLYFLMTRDDVKGAGLSGAILILATFTRPDHALFTLQGGLR